MSKATYWQRGETLDYKNTGTETIEANTVISFGRHIGVAGTDILPGEVGAIHVTGVFEMPKAVTEEIQMGETVYFNGDGITNVENDGETQPTSYPIAGYAVQAATAEDTLIYVKLTG